jgi:hypothetical protein
LNPPTKPAADTKGWIEVQRKKNNGGSPNTPQKGGPTWPQKKEKSQATHNTKPSAPVESFQEISPAKEKEMITIRDHLQQLLHATQCLSSKKSLSSAPHVLKQVQEVSWEYAR